jgi:cupin fold WbuC family metalloprotein
MQEFPKIEVAVVDPHGRVLLRQSAAIRNGAEVTRWGFLSEQIQAGESASEAIERGLLKGFGQQILTAKTEIRREKSGGCGKPTATFLVVLAEAGYLDERYSEGEAFAWFALDALVRLPLSPSVYGCLTPLLQHVSEFDPQVSKKLERALLDCGPLLKKNDRVFYSEAVHANLSEQYIHLLKELARYRGLHTFRVCLHQSDNEPIHEMVMVHTRPNLVGPLKQNKTTLSYHMLDGVADVCLLNDAGEPFWKMRLDSSDSSCSRSVRLQAGVYRTIQTLSSYAIFLEIASGPFVDSDTIWMSPRP